MKQMAAGMLETKPEQLEFTGRAIVDTVSGRQVTVKKLANDAMCRNAVALEATESHFSPTSPPPYMAGAAMIELDPETGTVDLIDFAAVVDCGTVINPALARVQVEGGLVQGIGMALMEDVQFTPSGHIQNNSFMQYRIPSRMDIGRIRVEFMPSYEPNGPFGAKSIGEIVINTPGPAIAHAVYNAAGLRLTELPITAEAIYMGLKHAHHA